MGSIRLDFIQTHTIDSVMWYSVAGAINTASSRYSLTSTPQSSTLNIMNVYVDVTGEYVARVSSGGVTYQVSAQLVLLGNELSALE